jgi:ribokinase
MIIVFGSINMDMFVTLDGMPEAGETVISPGFEMSAGGKGANQALAALRSGAKTALVARAGDDGMGTKIVAHLRREGVITSGVMQSDLPTGCAFIMRDNAGQNRIIVASGANAETAAEQIPDDILKPENILLMQMETRAEENWTLLTRARACGARTILNLAPAANIPVNVLQCVDILVVNEVEAVQLAGFLNLNVGHDVVKICEAVSKKGHLTCIITLGPKGALAWTKEGKPILTPALKLDEVVDTTGAGDAWCGTLAAALHEGKPLEEAMKRACIAGSLSCMKKGAQESFPWLGEINDKMTA